MPRTIDSESRSGHGDNSPCSPSSAVLLEARNGNYLPWAGAWALFLGASHLPEAALAAIVNKAAACNLPPEFLAVLTPEQP